MKIEKRQRDSGLGVTMTPEGCNKKLKFGQAPASILRGLHSDANRVLEIERLIERACGQECLTTEKTTHHSVNIWFKVLEPVIDGVYCYHLRKSKNNNFTMPTTASTLTETVFVEQSGESFGERTHSQKFTESIVMRLLNVYERIDQPALLVIELGQNDDSKELCPQQIRKVMHEIYFIKLKIASWLATWRKILSMGAELEDRVNTIISSVPQWVDELQDCADDLIMEHYWHFYQAFHKKVVISLFDKTKSKSVQNAMDAAAALRQMAREVLPVEVSYLPCEKGPGFASCNDTYHREKCIAWGDGHHHTSALSNADEDIVSVTTGESLRSKSSMQAVIVDSEQSMEAILSSDDEPSSNTATTYSTSGYSSEEEDSCVRYMPDSRMDTDQNSFEQQIEEMALALCVVGEKRFNQLQEVSRIIEVLSEKMKHLKEMQPKFRVTAVKERELCHLGQWTTAILKKGFIFQKHKMVMDAFSQVPNASCTLKEAQAYLRQKQCLQEEAREAPHPLLTLGLLSPTSTTEENLRKADDDQRQAVSAFALSR